MRFRIAVLFLLILTIISLAIPAHAQEGSWWDVFFPKNDPNDPRKTLQAPFADPDAVIMEPEEGSVLTLNVRHQTNAEISEWIAQRIPELISYDAGTYQQAYKDKIRSFDSFGGQEYLKFLQDSNILKSLSTSQYDVKGFGQDIASLLNEGAINGRYRWLFQIPIMITFVKTGTVDYKLLKDADIPTAEFILNIQVGRSEKAHNEYGLLIEAWKATPVKKEEEAKE